MLKTIHVETAESQNEGKFVPDSSVTESSGSVDASLAIPIDPNSTLVEDVSKIWHDPDKGSICVLCTPEKVHTQPFLAGYPDRHWQSWIGKRRRLNPVQGLYIVGVVATSGSMPETTLWRS